MLQVVAPSVAEMLHIKWLTINIVAGVAGFWSISSWRTSNFPQWGERLNRPGGADGGCGLKPEFENAGCYRWPLRGFRMGRWPGGSARAYLRCHRDILNGGRCHGDISRCAGIGYIGGDVDYTDIECGGWPGRRGERARGVGLAARMAMGKRSRRANAALAWPGAPWMGPGGARQSKKAVNHTKTQ